MTPARHMQTCVPLPVPRAQASFVITDPPWRQSFRLWWMVANRPGGYRLTRSEREIVRHFGPRRP